MMMKHLSNFSQMFENSQQSDISFEDFVGLASLGLLEVYAITVIVKGVETVDDLFKLMYWNWTDKSVRKDFNLIPFGSLTDAGGQRKGYNLAGTYDGVKKMERYLKKFEGREWFISCRFITMPAGGIGVNRWVNQAKSLINESLESPESDSPYSMSREDAIELVLMDMIPLCRMSMATLKNYPDILQDAGLTREALTKLGVVYSSGVRKEDSESKKNVFYMVGPPESIKLLGKMVENGKWPGIVKLDYPMSNYVQPHEKKKWLDKMREETFDQFSNRIFESVDNLEPFDINTVIELVDIGLLNLSGIQVVIDSEEESIEYLLNDLGYSTDTIKSRGIAIISRSGSFRVYAKRQVYADVILIVGLSFEIERLTAELDELDGIIDIQSARKELVRESAKDWKNIMLGGDSNETH